MLLAIVEMCLTIGSTAAALYSAVLNIRPWISFSDVHFQFSRIGQFRAFELPPATQTLNYVLWWLIPISAFLFFFFFAFGQDAVQEYGACLVWIRDRIFRIRVRESIHKGFNQFSSSAKYVHSLLLYIFHLTSLSQSYVFLDATIYCKHYISSLPSNPSFESLRLLPKIYEISRSHTFSYPC